ncbi:MAG TPA: transglutaminase-like domain-containing protein [Tissierellaceae bacterium]|nr:transglutaminase-like domain-containing protein [Tissierellaceae bacterium]
MERKENRLNNFIYFFMIFSLVYVIGLVINLDIDFILQIFLVALGAIIIKFLIFNPMFLYAFIGLSFISMILLNHFYPFFISPFFERTASLLSNIFHNLAGRENILAENALLFWGILIVLIASFTGIIIFKKKSSYLLLPVYLSSFLYYWYNYVDAAYWMMILFLFLFFVLITLNKYNLEVYTKDKLLIPDFKDLFPPWVWTGAVYGLIIIVLAVSLPKTTNVIQWTWLRTKVHDTFPTVENWRSSTSYSRKYGVASYFDFSLTGYESVPSRLGGPVELSDEKIMTVYADNPQYLRGNIKHKYTGAYWEILGSTIEDYRSGHDFSNLTKFEKRDYFEESTIKITFNNFSSKTIFSPYRPSRIYFEDNSRLRVDRDYGLMTPNGIYTGESYYTEVQVPLPYNELMKSEISYKRDDIIDIDKYLQIPDDKITQATRELTKDIVKDFDSDLEKAMAMEEYLRNNYEYSLDVSMVPENHEFIDYFLFQEKKGYCTYYATTLAIMLRLEDIPSRYIEGYLAKELKEDGVYEVTQENAHTWVEAFIEPIGWIRLEATPAYPISPRPEDSIDEGISEGIDNELDSTLPDREVLEEEGKIETQENLLNSDSGLDEDNAVAELEGNIRKYFLIFLALVFSVLPLRLLFVFLKLKYKDFKINKLSDRKKIIYLYNDILNLTKIMGYPQESGETHREYAERISFGFYYFDHKGIKEITEIFIKNKYGNSPVPKDDLLDMEKFKNDLKIRVRNNLGILRYLTLYLKL